MKAPVVCGECNSPARLTDGREIYPHRSDLADKKIWKCDGCGARVGCHPGTEAALGTSAGHALRKARMKLHNERLDPIWKPEGKRARGLIYAYLGHHLGLAPDQVHTGMFDIETCRLAWRVLDGVTVEKARAWADSRKEARST